MSLDKEYDKVITDWLKNHLQTFDLTDVVYFDYVFGIIQEDSTTDEDKLTGIMEFLSSATEKSMDKFKEEMIVHLAEWRRRRDEKLAEKKKKELEVKQKKEEEKRAAAQVDKVKDEPVHLDREARKQREELLMKYAYVEELDENGDMVYADDESDGEEEVPGLMRNDNSLRVQQESQMQREKSRADHQKKVERDKVAKQQQEAKKEKAKRKTEKHERRRQ